MRFVPLLLIASEAAASPCEVSIPRAPDDVRAAIESWVQAEPRCTTSLEVRVVPTDGGYYLLARDPAGRTRERIVPDAQSAGVLVASWMADDAAPGTPVEAAPDSTVIEVVPPAQITISAPGAVPAAVVDRVVAPPAHAPTRWLTLGGTLRTEDGGGGGVRAELDLSSWGPWSLGVAVGGSRSFSNDLLVEHEGLWEDGTLETRDLRATALLARTSRFGAWELRIQGGLGVVRTSASGFTSNFGGSGDGTYSAEAVGPTAEVSVQLSRRLGRNWAIGAGPLATFYSQQLDGEIFDNQSFEVMPMAITRQRGELSLFAGLRHRL